LSIATGVPRREAFEINDLAARKVKLTSRFIKSI
jgi:hypothetical protein